MNNIKEKLDKLASYFKDKDQSAFYDIKKISQENIDEGFDLLILIHPDAVIETSKENAKNYLQELKKNIPKFDKVITHFMFSYNFVNMDTTKKLKTYDVLLEIRNYLEKNTEHVHDISMGKESFENKIADLLMEKESLNIFIAGGNQDLCLRDSYQNFCSVLDWLVKEQNHSVKIFAPLVYHKKYYGKYDRESNSYLDSKPEGIGLRTPSSRLKEYPNQTFTAEEAFTEDEPWFKDINF